MTRDELIDLVLREYAYWRQPEPGKAKDDTPELACIRMGAMGACANLMAAISGHPPAWHKPKPAAVPDVGDRDESPQPTKALAI